VERNPMVFGSLQEYLAYVWENPDHPAHAGIREHLTMDKRKDEKPIVDADPDLVRRPLPTDAQAISPE
jgi:hypothetical protein